MQWLEDAWQRRDLPRPVVATIGNFDGVHRGQSAILRQLVERGRALGLPAVVVTFEPHPLTVVAPARAPGRLLSRRQKERLLAASRVDAVLEILFTPSFAATPADAFVRAFLHETLAVRELYVGSRFVFGRGREGDLELLRRLGAELGFAAHGTDEVEFEGAPISSSRIRRAVTEGRVADAGEMLGRVFALHGTIVHGERRGRELGWPTMNLAPRQDVIPARGVYVSEVRFAGEPARLHGVSNVGVRPTVSTGGKLVVETHILDFSSDVYGQEAEVGFLERLRDERAFENVEALSNQIGQDVEQARAYFACRPDSG
ncbi:MAG: riboflavin biosynthesis protein RibF [Acidobacteriota bacterium]|nr:riboflavin biosynthesis protein RibF [Acidobacteriota bacterium]MDH3525231.1 riboflavin biosynthesis protein RibF [Acidobacteriota bacterium]